MTAQAWPWKLIYRFEGARPEQGFTCTVEPRAPFRGRFFMFSRPECFTLKRYIVGLRDQLAAPCPCEVLHAADILVSTGELGWRHTIELLNSSSYTLPFYAELHGIAWSEEPLTSSEWEAPSTLVNLVSP